MTQTTEITPEAPEQEKIWAHSGDSMRWNPQTCGRPVYPSGSLTVVRVLSGARSTKSSTSTVSS